MQSQTRILTYQKISSSQPSARKNLHPFNFLLSGILLIYGLVFITLESKAQNIFFFQYQEGEWVVFQQRGQFGNPEDYFARDMKEYVVGFGDPSKEFWLGLDKLVSLTKNGAELWIEIETFEVIESKLHL